MKPFNRFLVSAFFVFGAGSGHAADSELVVFDWPGYEEPAFFQRYIEQHGDSPTFVFFGEEAEAFQKLRSGFRADLARPCVQSVQKWYDAGLIEPLDTSKIARWDDLDVDMRESFRIDGQYYFLPIDWGSTALTYRSDLVDPADMASLQVFLDPKYAGRVSIADNVEDAYALAYLAIGITDWTMATEADFERASAWLRKAHANVRSYWADGADLAQLMTSGEVLIAWAWNETPTAMQAEDIKVEANRETIEGSSTWFCGFVNLVNGPNAEDKMYDFFNAWLEPRSVEYLVTDWGYGHANKKAMAALGDETLNEAGLGAVSAPVLAQVPMDIALRERMIAEFERIKVGF